MALLKIRIIIKNNCVYLFILMTVTDSNYITALIAQIFAIFVLIINLLGFVPGRAEIITKIASHLL